MPERRQDRLDLSAVVADLNKTVGDLRITVGELKITIGTMGSRDAEDRQTLKDVATDVSSLKMWSSRIRGQIALIWLIFGALGAGGLAARILHWIP